MGTYLDGIYRHIYRFAERKDVYEVIVASVQAYFRVPASPYFWIVKRIK